MSSKSTATDAEFQNHIIIRDHTMNLPVVARQPHPDRNHAPRSRSAEPKGLNESRRLVWASFLLFHPDGYNN